MELLELSLQFYNLLCGPHDFRTGVTQFDQNFQKQTQFLPFLSGITVLLNFQKTQFLPFLNYFRHQIDRTPEHDKY